MPQQQQQGDLIDSFVLYSDQCSVLLRQALEFEEKAKAAGTFDANNNATAHNSDSESDEEGGTYDSEPSSSSEEEEENERASEGQDQPPDRRSDPDTDPTPAENPSRPAPQGSKKKKAKPTQTQQQQQHAIKKYVENLTCEALAINDSEVIHLPASLLSKHASAASIADRNYVPQSPCKEFLMLSEAVQDHPVVVILLRSGRFAAGIFQKNKCLVHRACQRYTVRKGQGKAQSTQDGSRRPKSVGSQLRRAGEENLQQDIEKTMQEWKSHLAKAALVLISCPKAMKKYLFDAMDGAVLRKDDSRIRRLPLDMGRPTFENVCMAHQVMMTVQLRAYVPPTIVAEEQNGATENVETQAPTNEKARVEKKPEIVIPLTQLHEACRLGDLEAISEILSSNGENSPDGKEGGDMTIEKMLNLRAGPLFMTCLHYATETTSTRQDEHERDIGPVDPERAAACVTKLLVEGRADPTILDVRSRPPYFLASHDRIRDAFRMARAALGEDFCRWDEAAKVPPALSAEDIKARKEKEAERKRKKKARQKQKKAQEKAEAEQNQRQREAAEQARKEEEDAKRVRDGLKPKPATQGTGAVCDFCQTVVKGRKRKDMFSRLEYAYCSAECVQKHKRELMAAAAISRFGGS
jgi:hypothetical protein